MIESAVLCPHPPLLLRELGGLADPVVDLRAACLRTLRGALTAAPALVVVAGAVDDPGAVDPGAPVDVRRFGTTGPRVAAGLPLSLGVGRRLLDEAGWDGPTELLGIDLDAGQEGLDAHAAELVHRTDRTVVLLLGGGSARRGDSAPGFIDDRAFAFDDELARALGSGDAAALRGLDTDVAGALMVDGRSVLRLLGALFPDDPATADLIFRDDPFGVSYFVAQWSSTGKVDLP